MTALADRVKESTTTTGTGSLTLSGAVAQFESFNTAFGTAAPFYYVITDANGTDWEVGTGELSNATTLVRTTVHQSSNADAKINLSAGTHTVFCSAPAVFLAGLASKSGKLSQFAATTSAELAGVISDETGSGALVFATSPTLTTPNIGVATATSVNGTTIPSSKTLVVTTDKLSALAATTSAELAGVISDETGTGSLVFASSPSLTTPDIGAATATSVNGTTIPSSKTLVVTTDKLSALAATTSAELAGVISDETGSGSLVFATSPSLTTPNIGTPSAGTLTNCTGLPVGGVSGLGTGVGTALAVNTGSAGAFVVNGGALGTPSSGTLTNATGLPVSTGVSGLGTGVATALAVNTGSSGAVVVNGGALGTPSSGTVTNLTGTASININGTVGATTPTTGAFTTLSATGVATFSAGTVTAPAITTSGDTNNGIYFPAADNVAITTGGTQRVLVDSSGNVGIGTSAPASKLDIPDTGANGLRLSGAGDHALGFVGYSGGASTQLFSIRNDGASVVYINTQNSVPLALGVSTGTSFGSTVENVRITSAGNVGIGTSSPGAKLSVSGTSTWAHINGGNSNTAPIFASLNNETVSSATYGWLWYNNSTNGNLDLYRRNGSTTDTQVLSFDRSNGNVGIGTTNPQNPLSLGDVTAIGQDTNSGYFGANFTSTGINFRKTGNYAQQIHFDTATGVMLFKNTSSTGTAGNAITFTERMRIDSSGNLLVGTTTSGGTGGVSITPNSSEGATQLLFNRTNRTTTSYPLDFRNNGTTVGYISYTDSATTYSTSSDRRLKENIAPAGNAQAILGAIQIVQHDWKAGGHTRFGVVAQDLNEVYPEAVSVGDDGETVEQTWAVDYSKLVPLLVKSIQEQQQQIDALKAEVAALKGNA